MAPEASVHPLGTSDLRSTPKGEQGMPGQGREEGLQTEWTLLGGGARAGSSRSCRTRVPLEKLSAPGRSWTWGDGRAGRTVSGPGPHMAAGAERQRQELPTGSTLRLGCLAAGWAAGLCCVLLEVPFSSWGGGGVHRPTPTFWVQVTDALPGPLAAAVTAQGCL